MARFTEEDDALLDELGVEVETKKDASRTPREERVVAGFQEIQRFVEQHGRAPKHGEDRDIFERLYAVRLNRIREQADCRCVLQPLDHQGLLAGAETAPVSAPDELDDDELLAQLGIEAAAPVDITELRHVRSAAEKRSAEEIANRLLAHPAVRVALGVTGVAEVTFNAIDVARMQVREHQLDWVSSLIGAKRAARNPGPRPHCR